ncbi:exodeoxyribonuclease VII large subunit [Kingella kingae]|nr:exodeoxyribonuclease VII large subunit [Kingella kingae]MDK4536308.1 exodeoxyribonuclease VII large subunit [Kingella kingae]MDK4538374.1 exodeoxyribonuclease VII large subunit [Kingella kingae]MDK4546470.1 exodeoxyribonuclease VII large subunit [Kingella kingae]MDK4622212.1 exodeoxyribonuclease VII large subunit [Kingella kingae]
MDLFAQTLSVSELNQAADALLDNEFSDVWISGEISNLTRAASGHYYFALKDDHAQVRCALFKFMAARLAVPLKEGDAVEVRGKIGIYGARGEFQITINEVRSLGLGQLFERYERLKARLQAEGLFDESRKQTLPEHPKAIGIVTSLAAAALRDVVSTLKRRAPQIPIIVYPTPVQGAGSEQHIAQAIMRAHQRREVDVLIVCRGGGSLEDLWAFNEEATVRAIAACTLPVVSGVGHETDFTLADFVADVRAPTPTAAAELVSPNCAEQLRHVQQLWSRVQQNMTQRYRYAAQKVDFLAQKLRTSSLHLLTKQQYRVAQQVQILQHRRPNIQNKKQQLDWVQAALQRAMFGLIESRRQQIDKQNQILNAMSPLNILQRGYAIVQTGRGQVVRDANDLRLGQKLAIRLADGAVDVQVAKQQNQADLFD